MAAQNTAMDAAFNTDFCVDIGNLNFGNEQEGITDKMQEELQKRLLSNKALIDIANPILLELHEFLVDSGFFIVLTDHEGCILKTLGDKKTIQEAQLLNKVNGAYMDEKSIGTNAMGTALSENIPIQITSKEHFISAYHRWTCSASPIHDISGKIIGCVNLTGNSTLGFVML
jgi:transcriptional regulator of acetoin/glycerol metabolism